MKKREKNKVERNILYVYLSVCISCGMQLYNEYLVPTCLFWNESPAGPGTPLGLRFSTSMMGEIDETGHCAIVKLHFFSLQARAE